MQDWPLVVQGFLDHAARWHSTVEVVSQLPGGKRTRTSYSDLRRQATAITNALRSRGVGFGDRIATLAMNSADHMAVSYGVTGCGTVFHTLNPRLAVEQLQWMVQHAGDRLIFADGALAPLAEQLARNASSIEGVIYLSKPAQNHPGTQLLLDFLRGVPSEEGWTSVAEDAAAGLCYTSGTTGEPKGVLYSHRSNVLHTLLTLQPDVFGLSARDVVMPIVPMYHANGWGLTFSAPAVGAKLVMPGSALDGASLCRLMRDEGVTFAAGVPTVWLAVLGHMAAHGIRLPSLRRAIVGGSALTPKLLSLFDELKVPVMHAWGMTELSPVGSACYSVQDVETLPKQDRDELRLKQGRVPYGIDMRIVDEHDAPLQHDGTTFGALQVRGVAVLRRYFRNENDSLDAEGFFDTGDVATIDRFGFMQIVDRAKDVIKSGGEWISSVLLENAALSHPAVAQAAAVGAPHPKWGERPILFVVVEQGQKLDPEQLLSHLAPRIPKWWAPERVELVASLPLGTTGKVDKRRLRSIAMVRGDLTSPLDDVELRQQ